MKADEAESTGGARFDLLKMADAALAAVDPAHAIRRGVKRTSKRLLIGKSAIDLSPFRRAVVLGIGKAAVGMGSAMLPMLHGMEVAGVLVADVAARVDPLEVMRGSHPVPDERSVRAGERVLQQAGDAGADDLVVVLISGGGSALVTVPADSLSLADLRQTNELLLRSGASITEVNTVRKHLSAIKGGWLAKAAAGAGAIVTLAISDVVGDDPATIASGPTVPDPTTFDDAVAVLARRGLLDRVPPGIIRWLRSGAEGAVPETPSSDSFLDGGSIHIVANGGAAADAAAAEAASLGYAASIVDTGVEGEAAEVAESIVAGTTGLEPGDVLVYAGETTVTVTGDGLGGRNQELALAAGIALDGRGDLTLLSLGTDGVDGVTPAAGAFADGSSLRRGRALGLDATDFLRRNDSFRYLTAIGDTVEPGPTGTNVGDLMLVVRERRTA